MSAEPPTEPVSPNPAAATTAPAPSATAASAQERRGLILILAAVQFVLMLLPLFVPVVSPPVPVEGSGGPPCVDGGGGPGGPTVIDNCQVVGSSAHELVIIAVLCALLSALVLPVVIGMLSRRWQTAVALPAAPFWVLTLLLGFIAVMARGDFGQGGSIGDVLAAYSQVFSLIFATPIVLMVLLAAALGGLGWLARRGFAR